MRKYLLTFLLALVIGFFLSNFFINQYDDFEGIKVSGIGDNVFFIQYGVFSSIESMEENTISLQNYVYNKQDELYYVYVGITKNEDNITKIQNYFKNQGYDTLVKEYQISNKTFLNLLDNYDTVLKETTDDIAIASLINQTLIKYEEVVINGS